MIKPLLFASAYGLAIGIPHAVMSQTGTINRDLSGTWEITDSSESKFQPKQVRIIRTPGTNSYVAFFTKPDNKCPVNRSARPKYLSKITLGQQGRTYDLHATGKSVPGRLFVFGTLVRCSSKGFITECGGKEIRNAKFGAALVVDRATGKVVRIEGTYRGHAWRVRRKGDCVRNQSQDTDRLFTLRRIN